MGSSDRGPHACYKCPLKSLFLEVQNLEKVPSSVICLPRLPAPPARSASLAPACLPTDRSTDRPTDRRPTNTYVLLLLPNFVRLGTYVCGVPTLQLNFHSQADS